MSLLSVNFVLIVLLIVNAKISKCNENSESEKNTLVSSKSGKIRGTVLQSSLGRDYYAFRGIRYGKPPIGELRFKAPEKIEPWSDTFDASQDGPSCPQPRANFSDMSEDCLRLNVYTTLIPQSNNGTNLKPVIIYLHPGGFYVQSAQSWNYAGPAYFMDRDVVLVTLNYRLGLLGFLSTGTEEAPGNAGLKDQVLALKWVRDNISIFGGDAGSITLLGYSAGARSVTYHLVSRMSSGLFHKAIVMSGSSLSQIHVPNEQLDLAQKQARLLQCTIDNIKEMVKCLRSKDSTEFVKTLKYMFEFVGHPVLLYRPVIENDFGQERFLTEHPQVSYETGNFMKIPIITGINTDEFAVPAVYILKNETLRSQFENEYERLAPICFMYEWDTERSKETSSILRKKYLGEGPLDAIKSVKGLAELFADAITGFANYNFVKLAAKWTKVYHYKFSYKGNYSHYNAFKGVVHHDDLLYLFRISNVAPIFTSEYPERLTVERLTRMWTNFANDGDPNDSNDEYLKSINWRPFTTANKEYLDIGNKLEMKEKLYGERFATWEKLFPRGSLS